MILKPFRLLTGLLFVLHCPLWAQEIGLHLNSLRDQFAVDAAGTMRIVRDMGFRQVEMTETFGLPFPRFIKLLAQNELSVVSFGTTYEKLENDAQAIADEARSYGAKYVICYSLQHNGVFSKQDADRTSSVLNKAAKIMTMNGLLLCYQPRGDEFSADGEDTIFDYLVRNLSPGIVYLQMDVSRIKQAGQEPLDLLRKYPTRFISIHLNDRKTGSPSSGNGTVGVGTSVPLGAGDVGIGAVMQAARDLGIQYFFIDDESSQAPSQIPQSLTYLKSLQYQTRK